MKTIISNNTTPLSHPIEVTVCSTFYTKLRGLMFQKQISPFDGILLIEKKDSIINSAIHMFFMNFDICVVWINSSDEVVDKHLAKRWHMVYKPHKPANKTLELHPRHMFDFNLGDKITYEIP